MPKRITPSHIKTNNRQQIYDFIYQKRKVSQQDILYALHLSRPTVTANLSALEEEGVICKSGQIESDQIGRKAFAYSIVPDYRVAVGVEILRTKAKMIAIDLYGEKLRREVAELPFSNDPDYYNSLCAYINRFVDALTVSRDHILGIGISAQGLASVDGFKMVYAPILGCTGLTIDVFENNIHLPCRFVHDARGAALSELWISPELTNAFYLSLSSHLGGAMISERHIMPGKHGHNSTFEHIKVRSRGELCYCGKRGCWDTLLCRRALTGNDTLDTFFDMVYDGDVNSIHHWNTYLKYLAQLIASLHLVYDVDIILGGHLAPYFTEADILLLYDEIRQLCPFEEEDDFIHISKMPSHNITVGIALPFIHTFLEEAGVELDNGV